MQARQQFVAKCYIEHLKRLKNWEMTDEKRVNYGSNVHGASGAEMQRCR